jgi:hypothetical protein
MRCTLATLMLRRRLTRRKRRAAARQPLGVSSRRSSIPTHDDTGIALHCPRTLFLELLQRVRGGPRSHALNMVRADLRVELPYCTFRCYPGDLGGLFRLTLEGIENILLSGKARVALALERRS